jgi:hypothetical protein
MQSLMRRQQLRWLSATAMFLLGIAMFSPSHLPGQTESDTDATARNEQIQQQIKELILQLGDDEPRLRERAEAELKATGMAAFEALEAAEQHEDIEIRLRVQQILDGLRKSANEAAIAPPLEIYLHNISSRERAGRAAAIQLALQAEPELALAYACQAVRFDKADSVSKSVAAAIMNQLVAVDDSEQLTRRQTVIQENIAPSNRTACRWLRSYAKSLTSPAEHYDEFRRLIGEEARRRKYERDESAEDLTELLQFAQLDLLHRSGKQAELEAELDKFVASMEGERDTLWRLSNWLNQRKQLRVQLTLAERYKDTYYEDRLLRYAVAHAMHLQGDDDAAEALAKETLAWPMGSVDGHPSANQTMQQLQPEAFAMDDKYGLYYLVADQLQEAGMTVWGELELQRAVEAGGALDQDEALTRWLYFCFVSLAESLHDRGLDAEAAAFYEPLGKAVEAENQQILTFLGDDAGDTASRWRYFRSQAKLAEGDISGAKQELERGIKNSLEDSDVLIAMYRLPDQDEAWQASTKQYIQRAVAKYRTDINRLRMEAQQNNRYNNVLSSQAQSDLQQTLNQFAWLVGNTEGNIEEAIRFSLESLGVLPKGSQLDTLGRCYYRANDLENAIRYQQQAVRLMPYSVQLRKQLELFQSEARKASENRN